MNKKKTSLLANLSDDVLAAMIARNELRKLGLTVAGNTNKFLEIFHEYSDVSKGNSEKHAASLEKQRKLRIAQYVQANLAVKDNDGNPTDTILTE